MSLGNCLAFAVRLYVRRRRRGVPRQHRYLMWRGSWTKVGHVLYAERRHYGWRIVSYKPDDPRPRILPPPWFRGHTDWGDW
jgi:hypothetical protein